MPVILEVLNKLQWRILKNLLMLLINFPFKIKKLIYEKFYFFTQFLLKIIILNPYKENPIKPIKLN